MSRRPPVAAPLQVVRRVLRGSARDTGGVVGPEVQERGLTLMSWLSWHLRSAVVAVALRPELV